MVGTIFTTIRTRFLFPSRRPYIILHQPCPAPAARETRVQPGRRLAVENARAPQVPYSCHVCSFQLSAGGSRGRDMGVLPRATWTSETLRHIVVFELVCLDLASAVGDDR